MLELLNTPGRKRVLPVMSGPGPQVIAHGDAVLGFFGEVSSTDMVTGSALATAIGLTSATAINDKSPWLKFSLDERILFIPRLPFRHSITWQDIYQSGAVYGDDTYGLYPSGANRVQNARISVGEFDFRVRLLKGAVSDPFTGVAGSNSPSSINSEWDRLFYPLSTTATPTQPSPKWNLYTDLQLGVNYQYSGGGSYSWCQEKVNNNAYRAFRGYVDITYFQFNVPTTVAQDIGWRPVLELVS